MALVEIAADVLADAFRIPFIQYSSPDPGVAEVLLDVPIYRQTHSYTCGFVSGLMVLHTFYPHADVWRFFDEVKPSPEQGVTIDKLVRALRMNTIGVSIKRSMDFDDIVKAIDRGFPIITSVVTAAEDEEHWVVIYGYGEIPPCVYVGGDTLLSPQRRYWEDFRDEWGEGRVCLVCWGK